MKKSSLIIVVIFVLLLANFKVVAQAPQLINYQAVARDLSGNALVSTPVNVVYDIRQSTPSGTVVYSETHSLSTNQFGLFTAQIGSGIPVIGTFGSINWGAGLYYLQVTVNGDVMTATQLWSVPYALHANTATSGVPGANGHANLADSVFEPAGVNCVNGGYLINMGVDDNDDATLQPLEIDISYYICNGIDGAAANNNDTSATNELQTLSISNDTLFISGAGGNYVLLTNTGSLWQPNLSDIYFNTGKVGIGMIPSSSFLLSVSSSTEDRTGYFYNDKNSANNTFGLWAGAYGTGSGNKRAGSFDAVGGTGVNIGVRATAAGGSTNWAGYFLGNVYMESSSSATNPTLNLHETTSGLSKIKHTNSVPNKYWIVEAGLNSSDPLSGYSIGYNDGATTSLPFIVYGDNKVGVNNIANPLASFHVMDINNTGNGMVTEGFNQPGLLVVARNNFVSPNRAAINNGDQIGKIIFPGYAASSYGDGPQIVAYTTENFTSTSNGSELFFRTIPNGTNVSQDALRLLNDGTVEVPVNFRVLNGAGTAGDVLTSDALGNATWQPVSGGGINDTSLIDADGDTYIHVEASPDQDVIHFGMGNSGTYSANEYFTMIGPRLEVINSGGSVMIGQGAGANDDLTFNMNTFIGDQAGNLNTTGVENVALGTSSFLSNTSGNSNIAIGTEALRLSTTANANTAVGYRASQNNTTGVFNSSFGYEVLRSNQLGQRNSAFGTAGLQNSTGNNNSSVGAEAGITLTSGDDNTFIGKSSDAGIAILNNATAIGANAVVSQSNSLILGNNANVGIGISTPSEKLEVIGTTKTDNLRVLAGAGTAGDVLTSDAAGNASWKENAIAFFVGGGGSNNNTNIQTLVTGTPETLEFEVALSNFYYNKGSGYNSTTHHFIASVAGVYKLEASVQLAGASTGYFYIDMMHSSGNGITSQEGFFDSITQNRCTRTLSATVHLNAGEEVWIEYLNTNGASSFYKSNSSYSGHLVYAD